MPAVTDIGIDLGTSSILVYVRGRGIIMQEPSLAAYDKDAEKVIAFGEEAEQKISRGAGNLMAIRPLKGGVISDYVITEKMLQYFIQKSMGPMRLFKPHGGSRLAGRSQRCSPGPGADRGGHGRRH